MPGTRPFPRTGSIYLDSRGPDRVLRVSWHHEAGLVVLSLWRDNLCTGSFRLSVEDVPALVDALRSGLDAAHRHAPTRTRSVPEQAGEIA